MSHEASTGDDRGGIAWVGAEVFYSGDDKTVRARVANLSTQTTLTTRLDGMFSDLATGELWSFADADLTLVLSGDTQTEGLAAIDPLTGQTTGLFIPFDVSEIVGLSFGPVGIFAGVGRVALLVEGTVHLIDLATGEVSLGPRPTWLGDVFTCESWAYWGLLETFGGDDWLTYIAFGNQVVRVRVRDGLQQQVEQLDDLGDACSMTVDPTRGRWLFHHELDSQFFAPADEVLVSCPASICRDGSCTCAPGAELCPGGCKATARDHANCGGCGLACTGAGESCDGTCGCDPADYNGMCGSDCVDFDGDDARCGNCTTSCGADQDCIDGICRIIPELSIASLSMSSCSGVELAALIGNHTGGLALGDRFAFVRGVDGTAAATLPSLASPQNIGPGPGDDFMLTDALDESLWSLRCGAAPCSWELDADGVAHHDGNDGSVRVSRATNRRIDDLGLSMIFAGNGRSAVLASSGLYVIDHATGYTERLPPPRIGEHMPATCSDLASVGVLERRGDDDWLVYISGDGDVVRLRARDDAFDTILSADLGGACALALSPADGRWLFVAQGSNGAVANPSDDTQLVSCPAVFTCAGCP